MCEYYTKRTGNFTPTLHSAQWGKFSGKPPTNK